MQALAAANAQALLLQEELECHKKVCLHPVLFA